MSETHYWPSRGDIRNIGDIEKAEVFDGEKWVKLLDRQRDDYKREVITNMYYDACRQYTNHARNNIDKLKPLTEVPGMVYMRGILDWLEENYKDFINKP